MLRVYLPGILEFTLGTVLVFLFGLLLTLFFNAWAYRSIKAEFMTGKTDGSSLKSGYKKTLAGRWTPSGARPRGGGAPHRGGGHARPRHSGVICVVSGAFCNLLWTRFISCMLLSASKDKYKYFGFVREDDDDE